MLKQHEDDNRYSNQIKVWRDLVNCNLETLQSHGRQQPLLACSACHRLIMPCVDSEMDWEGSDWAEWRDVTAAGEQRVNHPCDEGGLFEFPVYWLITACLVWTQNWTHTCFKRLLQLCAVRVGVYCTCGFVPFHRVISAFVLPTAPKVICCSEEGGVR